MQKHLIYIHTHTHTPNIFRTKNDIPRIFLEHRMHFLWVNVPFYEAVSIMHDVITTPNPFPYTAKFMVVGVTHYKTQQIRKIC